MRKGESKVERSCARKKMKMNARATSWVTHGDETFFLHRQLDLDLEPITHSYPSLYVRATYVFVSCTAHLEFNKTVNVLPTSRMSMRVLQATPHIVGFIPSVPGHKLTYTPMGSSGSLSTVNETCNNDKRHCTKKNYCRYTSFKSLRTLKSGVHL